MASSSKSINMPVLFVASLAGLLILAAAIIACFGWYGFEKKQQTAAAMRTPANGGAHMWSEATRAKHQAANTALQKLPSAVRPADVRE
jgi:hypothetical protein